MRLQIKSLRKVLGCSALAMSLFAAPALLSPLGMGGQAFADEDQPKPRFAKSKTKRVQAMSPTVAKNFAKAQEAAEAENWPEMLNVLNDLKAKMSRYNGYEKASVYGMFAYYYYSVENLKQAIASYEQMLKFADDLPDARVAQTLKQVGQLYLVEGEFRKALQYLYDWMAMSEIVTAKDKNILAQAHFQVYQNGGTTKDMNLALRWIEEAISDYQAKGQVPEENWWGLQRYIYYEKKDYNKVIEILETIVQYYPKVKYWTQLGAMYGEKERDLDRLVTYDTLYMQGKLTKEARLRGLAYMYASAEAPYKAATIMEWGFKNGYLEENAKDLKLMADLYYQSRDVKKSIPVMEKAAKLSEDGVMMERLAAMYFNNEEYKKSVNAANEATRKGGLKNPGNNYLTLGMAYAEMKQFNKAIEAFKKSAKYPKSKKYAEDWMRFTQSEKARYAQIEKSRKELAK